MKFRNLLVLTALVTLALASFSPVAAERNTTREVLPQAPSYATTHTFSDPSTLNIPGSGDDAGYVINVSGLTETVLDVNVYINGLSTTAIQSLDFLLVGPGGQNVILFSFGCSGPVTNRTWGFDDEAGGTPPGAGNGCDGDATYQPSDFSGGNYALGCVNALAPAPPYGTALSTFDGVDPNGTWYLWIAEYCGLGSGDSVMNNGWTIEITTEDPVDPGPGPVVAGPPPFTVPNIGLVMVYTNMAQPVYESPGGGVLRGAGAQEVWIPADADGNGFDTYVVTEVVTVDGEVWLGIFLGERNWGYVPYDSVIAMEYIPGTD